MEGEGLETSWIENREKEKMERREMERRESRVESFKIEGQHDKLKTRIARYCIEDITLKKGRELDLHTLPPSPAILHRRRD